MSRGNKTILYEGIEFTINPKMLINGKPDPDLLVTRRDSNEKIQAMVGHPETVRKVLEYKPRLAQREGE